MTIENLIMPSSKHIEKSVLGAFILYREMFLKYSYLLTPDYFYVSTYHLIFNVMISQSCTDYKILIELLPHLEQDLFELIDSHELSSDFESEIKVLRDKYERRKLIEISYGAIKDASTEYEKTSSEIIDQTISSINENHFVAGKPEHIATITPRVFERMQASHTGESLGFGTGLSDVDKTLGGFMPSELAIIAARPSMGKTSFINQIIRWQSISCGNPVLFFSLEMAREQIAGRIVFSESNASYGNALLGRKTDLMSVMSNIDRINAAGIYIDDTPGMTVNHIQAKSENYVKHFGVKMIFIDHCGFIKATHRGRSKHEEISEISKALVGIGKRLNVPVILVSQLSRAVENRNPPIPQLSDLRESGSLEEDARKVILLYREDYYKKDSEKRGIASVIVAKNHNGETAHTEVFFDLSTMNFRNLEKNHEGTWHDSN